VHAAIALFAVLILFIVIDDWLGADERGSQDSDHEL
jgi:hypothetical protein